MSDGIRSILVPTDFSDTSNGALSYAKTLAADLDAALHVVHVFEDPSTTAAISPDVYAALPQEFVDEALQAAQARLDACLTPAERQRLRGMVELRSGPVVRAIEDFADAHAVDLIVMGTHGRTGLTHVLLGSVAEAVVRTAQCPVLTVSRRALERAPATRRSAESARTA